MFIDTKSRSLRENGCCRLVIKLSLSITPLIHAGHGGIALRILKVGHNLKWVVIFTPRPLYLLENSLAYPSCGDCLGPGAGLDPIEERRNDLPLQGIEPRFLSCPACCLVIILNWSAILTYKDISWSVEIKEVFVIMRLALSNSMPDCDSSVGIVGSWDSIPGGAKRFFCTPRRPDHLWSPPSLLSNGYQGVKRPGLEADQSIVDVRNGGVIPPLSHIQVSSGVESSPATDG
jgi:hypothetical protein